MRRVEELNVDKEPCTDDSATKITHYISSVEQFDCNNYFSNIADRIQNY